MTLRHADVPHATPRPSTGGYGRRDYAPTGRGLLTLLLIGAVGWSVLQVPWRTELVHPGGGAVFVRVLRGLLSPDLSPAVLARAASAAWQTVAYAITGMSVALLLAIPLGVVASGVLARGPFARGAAVVAGRGVAGVARAIHELVWAWLFVAAIGLSPFAAILALAIPYAGILGRIYAEQLVDVPAAPLRALRSAGAGNLVVLAYGRLPMALPDLVSYSLYRFECGLRSAAILSFVGLGGLGTQIQLALDDLAFSQVATYLLVLVVLVAAVDAWSSELRKRLAW